MSDLGHYASYVQRQASDPARSVWVNASAGTGKTKVLIERVLRLMLPREDGRDGSYPDRILCLTYTKAAAAEMTERLIRHVSAWVVMDEVKLAKILGDLLGFTPLDVHLRMARRLFSIMVDGPDKVRIQTIHSFCQSVLARFPLEAGLSPNFVLVEGAELESIMTRARHDVMNRASIDRDLGGAIERLSSRYNDDGINRLIKSFFVERRQLQTAIRNHPRESWPALLKTAIGLEPDYSFKNWAEEIGRPDAPIRDRLLQLSRKMQEGVNKDIEIAGYIALWLASADPVADFDILLKAFFKKGGDPRRNNGTEGIRRKNPDVLALYGECQEWAIRNDSCRRGLALVDYNADALLLVAEVYNAYDQIKRSCNAVDFDDIIRYTARLLSQKTNSGAPMAPWVMFKLDGGIDHILLDEAQDTSPEQWEIVRSLVNEFYHGLGQSREDKRTVFIVGDQKQSIYSFQGADADAFEHSLDRMAQQGVSSAGGIERISMNVSFRTVEPVLALVDQVFLNEEKRKSVRAFEEVVHLVNRAGHGGSVELWPLIKSEKIKNLQEQWPVYRGGGAAVSQVTKLTDKIAAEIRLWLDSKYTLPSWQRPVEPRDILILVRNRKPYLHALMLSLQRAGIPVGGLDRMKIMDSPAIVDVLTAARFSALPSDDLNLACFLTSPFIGLNDDDLIRLCVGRAGTFYEAIQSDPYFYYCTLFVECLRTG